MSRERALKVVLVVVGLIFCGLAYPLMMFVKHEPALGAKALTREPTPGSGEVSAQERLVCSASHTVGRLCLDTGEARTVNRTAQSAFSFQRLSPGCYDQGFGGIAC